MSLMSSIAKTLVGSVIAIVSVAPERLNGTIWYLCAVSGGISLTTPGSVAHSGEAVVGSVVAIVSVAPERLNGTIWYLCAVSGGISLTTPGSMSNWARLMEGT